MKRYTMLVGMLVVASVAYVGATQAIDAVMLDAKIRNAEAECVAKLIPLRVERRNIATGNGTCWRTDL